MQSVELASRVSAAAIAAVAFIVSLPPARAADLPGIKVAENNMVPACATPGRLQAYMAKRNPGLDPQFKSIAADYMREGEALGLRWDVAFFQMMLETGQLSYAKGARIAGIKPEQNNFAGLRPIDKNAAYESFPDVATGVRAHLQHVVLYTGETVAEPVAQRTRRLQEMGLLATWRKTIKHDVTFEDLADKWTDGSDTYADRLQDLAKKFNTEFCNAPDPQPELLAAVRGASQVGPKVASAAQPDVAKTVDAPAAPEKISGVDLARRAIVDGSDQRSGLGAGSGAPAAPVVRMLNAPLADAVVPEALVPEAPTQKAKLPVPQLPRLKPSAQSPTVTKTAATGAAAKAMMPVAEPQAPVPDAPAATLDAPQTLPSKVQPATGQAGSAQKCRVFTASYGGHRAVIVRAVVDQIANFTVLDVNDGQEQREAEAYIAAYAKGGSVTGEFTTQDKALEKAFELCPEG